jgi:hypothetical protein
MPPLPRNQNSHSMELPARKAMLIGETDVLVVGGGPAGLGAALGAAQAGVKIVLAERYGFLGGNATAALVMPLMSFHTQRPQAEVLGSTALMPTDHGPGESLIAGALDTFLTRLVRAGGAIPPSLKTGYTVPFDPEIFKLTAMELLDEFGIEYLFHAFASGTVEKGKVRHVVFESKSGPVVMKARMIVDCTGDGDIAASAGADYELGRDVDHMVQPMTLMFRMGHFEKAAFSEYVGKHPDQWRGVHGLWDLLQKASAAGDLNLPREDILFFGTLREDEVAVNSTRIIRVSGTDVWDLSYAEWQGRRQMKQISEFLRRYVPGFGNAFVMQSGIQVGVRETRRITGEYRLTADDILSARKFDDVIARSSYPVDIHNPRGSGTLLKRLPPGEFYEIPLRCLIPTSLENVLVAGRCISGTHEAHSSYRVMPTSMATGQAAGVCAALAVLKGSVPREIPFEQVQRELIRQGARLGT